MKDSQFIIAEKLYQRVTDGTHDSPKPQKDGFPLVTSKNIKGGILDISTANLISKEDYDNINKRSKVEKWDVIISMIGEYCGFTYIEKSNEINYAVKNVGLFKTGSKLEANWLSYYLQSDYGKYYLQQVKSGSSQPYLSLGALRKLPILNPSNEIKQGIVNILSALDDKIELNNRINDELEQIARTLYNYWFVQFDFPDKNGKPYKSSGGKMVYSQVLKRNIPKHWEVKVFNEWIDQTKAGDWGKESSEGNYTERVFCVRGADINGLNGKGEIKAPERFILKNNLLKALKPSDFIIEISGGSPTQSTARIALMTEKTFERFDTNVICSNFCKAVSIKDENYVFNFQQEWQGLYDSGIFFGYEGKTSGIKNFLFDSFMNSYHVVFPDKDVVGKYYKFAKSLEEKKQSNLQQNQQLFTLRDWLLPMLMNGQIKVDNRGMSIKPSASMPAEPRAGYGKSELLTIPVSKTGFAKQVLAGKIVSQFIDDPNFTDIKFQKIQFLAEHIIEADLNLNYYCQAAGPYDNKFMHTIYTDFRKQKWFDCQENRFIPFEKQKKIEGYYQGYFASVQDQLNKLFDLLYPTSEAEAEIIATLYAVWNNRIIEGQTVTDEVLIKDFYLWSDRKQQYTKEQVTTGLKWLRKHQIEPRGFGKLVKKAKAKS